jgi:hypothetical protein
MTSWGNLPECIADEGKRRECGIALRRSKMATKSEMLWCGPEGPNSALDKTIRPCSGTPCGDIG